MSYHSSLDKVAKGFYIPLLREACVYKRAVGFFSSSIFSVIATGITSIAANGGTIQLVASPKLSEEDILAIQQGYEMREEVVKAAIRRELVEPRTPFERRNLNLLANLIADGVMDIKIALTQSEVQAGMFHVKMGLVEDSDGNIVAFTGSMNESLTALELNYESIDVYCSWKTADEQMRVADKLNQFTSIWNDTEPNVSIVDFSELKQEILDKYKRTSIIDYTDEETEISTIENPSKRKGWLRTPDSFTGYFDYQREAMEKWRENGYRGIFDMATGTGKTLTALGALELLCDEVKDNLGVIIVCPYQHLIEQWVEDIVSYGVTPIICYSRYDWKRRFKYALSDFSCGATKNFCVITTNDTLATKYFQDEVDKLSGNICLVVDEAHNFGATRQLDCMKEVFSYRLALSATLERRYDEYGTARLMEFFGDKCMEYPLERAIREDKLTPYYYYPIPVYFELDELDEYNELTEKIVKILLSNKKEAGKLPKSAEMLLIKRARIVASARGKLKALYDIISEDYLDNDHILVYCGATTVTNSSYKEGQVELDEKRQIDIVVNMLGTDLGMRVRKFTSEESSNPNFSILSNM